MVLCDPLPLPDLIPGDGDLFKFLNLYLWSCLGAILIILAVATPWFYYYYVKVDYDTWRWKTNPKFPTAEMIKLEIIKTTKGAFIAAFFPALSLFLVQIKSPYTQGYCGLSEERDIVYHVKQFVFLWIVTDFYEFFYHHLGHTYDSFWEQHKSHHKFYNPSPFAVIADDFVDQVLRAFPMLLLPLCFPVNMELMFAQWGSLFYIYGTYLHWGYESRYVSAHNRILNTSYDHHLHHRISIKNKAIRTGFFFKIWDELFDSTYKSECLCVRCEHSRGKRSEAEWKSVELPDYSVLLSPNFWLTTTDPEKLK